MASPASPPPPNVLTQNRALRQWNLKLQEALDARSADLLASRGELALLRAQVLVMTSEAAQRGDLLATLTARISELTDIQAANSDALRSAAAALRRGEEEAAARAAAAAGAREQAGVTADMVEDVMVLLDCFGSRLYTSS